jgi:hypothetical protein
MCAARRGGAEGRDRRVGEVEGGLAGTAQQPGPGIAGVDDALDTDDGLGVGLPVVIIEFAGGIEAADGAAFVAVAPFVMAVVRTERAVVAESSAMFWCRVGWLLLSCTIDWMPACLATSNSFFDSVLHRV